MKLLKDQSIFKSSGMYLLQSPSQQAFSKDTLLTNSNFFARPSGKEVKDSRRVSQQSEQLSMIQKTIQESLPQIQSLTQLNSQSINGSRKTSLKVENFSSEQLKDWLIGKQPSTTNNNIFQDKSENKLIKNSTNAIKILNNNQRQLEPYVIENNTKQFEMSIENKEKEGQLKEQNQERQIIKRVQRRAQSDIVQQQNNNSESPKQQPVLNDNDKNKNLNENEDNTSTNSSQQTSSVRKRTRLSSLNYQSINQLDMEVQQQQPQQSLQHPLPQEKQNQENKKQDQTSNGIEKMISKSAVFASANKFNRSTFSSSELSPLRSPYKIMETSQNSADKSGSKIQLNLNNLPSFSQQPQKKLTQRQILLKDLQNITDSHQLFEKTNAPTYFNYKQNGINVSHTALLNQQLNNKPNVFNSPLSSASQSSLEELPPINNQTISVCLQQMPIIRKRQVKNVSLSNFDNISKLQMNASSTKSSIASNGWGSFSSFDNLNEQQPQFPTQLKGILKTKNISSKQKKSVNFDKKLQIYQIDQIIQA